MRKLHEWLIQMYILKDEMQHYLLNDFVAKHKFPIEDVVQIRAAFADTDSARKKLANYPDELPADTYWKSTMCEASQEFCAFVENICISTDYNETLKTALKANRETAAVQVLECQHIKDAVERVLEILEKHLTANSKALTPMVEVVDKMPEAPEVPENQRLGTPLATVQTLLLANPDESDHWRAVAERRVQQYIKLVHVSSLSEMEAQLSSSSIACTKGDLTGLVGFFYDTKLAGEAATNPQIRICPLQEKHYQGQVRSLLKVRRAAEGLATTSLGAGEVALILDGGKGGNARKLLSPWHPGITEDLDDDETEGQMVKRTVHVIKTEESARNSVDMSLAGFSNTCGGIEHACAEGAFTGVVVEPAVGVRTTLSSKQNSTRICSQHASSPHACSMPL